MFQQGFPDFLIVQVLCVARRHSFCLGFLGFAWKIRKTLKPDLKFRKPGKTEPVENLVQTGSRKGVRRGLSLRVQITINPDVEAFCAER